MKTIFNSYESSVARYDTLMDKAGTLMNEVSFMYTSFVSEILKRLESDIHLSGIVLPLYNGVEYETGTAERIFTDEERGFPHIAFTNGSLMPFSELNVAAQDLIVQYIFMEIKTADVYRSLFSKQAEDDAPK
jgi:hypothetical protein